MTTALKRVGTLLFAVLLSAAAIPAQAQQTEAKTSLRATDVGTIYFMSARHDTNAERIYQKRVVLSDVIKSELRFPENMKPDTKVPAMVVMHSSGGVTQDIVDWCKYLNSLGYATLMVDSFATRGIQRTAENQKLLAYGASAVDALQALKLLSTDPNIDRNRIGLIGFSKGGHAGLMASFEKIRQGVIDDDLKFAIHILFYPVCSIHAKTTGAPIRIITGTKDDMNSIEGCRNNYQALKNDGADVEEIEYDGAYHGFDTKGNLAWIGGAQTWKDCAIGTVNLDTGTAKMVDGRVMSGKEFAAMRDAGCMKHGISAGGAPKWRTQSKEDVKAILAKQFGVNPS